MDESSELSRRRRELEALQAIALAANRGERVRDVIEAAVEVIHRTFAATLTTWLRHDAERVLITLEHSRGDVNPRFLEELRTLPVGTGVTGLAVQTRRAQITTDYHADPRAMKSLHVPPFKGVITAPVCVSDAVLAVISVGSTEQVYDEIDLSVLAGIGAQIGVALENARLLEQLRASEARYRNFIEAVPYAVYEARPAGEVLYASPKIFELTGHEPARFEREPGLLAALVHPNDRAERTEALGGLKKPGDRATLEYRLVHANGVDIVWVSDQVQVREGAQGLVLLGVLVDLRDRKMIEAAAREHARLASLGELAAGVAHEVNNPLSGVINYAQLARRIIELRPDGALERLVEPIEGIVAEADRILEITRTLVSFARRPEKEDFRPLPAHELIRASLTIMKQRLKETSIALDVDVPEDLPPLRARGHELVQVLQNLITNARHALDQRFPRWDPAKRLSFKATRIPPDAQSSTGYVRIDVMDRGAGIAPEHRDKIFVPFFTTKPSGTGLGLPIAREIVLAHGGKMDVSGVVGGGTTFSFTIPAF